ncbi:hypothetical protein CAPTEDRAFT_209048 [Capitella teleta]|uniref:XPG-I domain-containing protein n=1 Tax=Capitella teleta TaxID=283909 RepID=R7TIH5_CAPTE|nr:hypothetical protein CAPTEDRAFT_209048 [Capitella teleta]|eukprot:ELT93282.1 hypothetical protein CAPTEDRAFT_209048 [Capitella teleta]
MGVTHLWPLLKPAGQIYSWEDLRGRTLAVDSAIWLMETEQIPCRKPHLKNALSRIMTLMRHDVRLVFVLEGQKKELKAATLAKRSASPVKKACRSLFPPAPEFSSKVREMQHLLDLLGIPSVQSSGEAEALCGVLNERGVVEGVITNDSDAFLFGATKVYKNFTANKAKESEQEVYRMKRLQGLLGADRKGLVALALLAGCDFTSGSQGVGSTGALKLLKHWGPQVDPIERYAGNDFEIFLALCGFWGRIDPRYPTACHRRRLKGATHLP